MDLKDIENLAELEALEAGISQEEIDAAKETFKFPLPKDVEALMVAGKGSEAYRLLCSKYPADSVKRFQLGEPHPVDHMIIPSWIGIIIMSGEEDLIRVDGQPSPFERSRLILRNDATCFTDSVIEYLRGKKEGRWAL